MLNVNTKIKTKTSLFVKVIAVVSLSAILAVGFFVVVIKQKQGIGQEKLEYIQTWIETSHKEGVVTRGLENDKFVSGEADQNNIMTDENGADCWTVFGAEENCTTCVWHGENPGTIMICGGKTVKDTYRDGYFGRGSY